MSSFRSEPHSPREPFSAAPPEPSEDATHASPLNLPAVVHTQAPLADVENVYVGIREENHSLTVKNLPTTSVGASYGRDLSHNLAKGNDQIAAPRVAGKTEKHHAMTFGDDQGNEPTPAAYDPTNKWWALSLESVFNLVQLDDALSGLDRMEIQRHSRELGNNIIRVKGGVKWYTILARQFMNAITIVLIIVIIVSIISRDWAELGVVVAILIFNAALGFYQEFSAEKSLKSLKQMTAGVAKVMRNNAPEIIFIDEVVVGDVIILEQGACVPADCRIFESNSLEVDEALLTGEALPVMKHANVIRDPESRCALGDRKNMVYRNTLVTQGRGKAVVTSGGIHTEMGKLADRLSQSKGDNKTELMKKLDYMMYILFLCCIVLAIVVFAANRMQYDPTTLSYATAVAVAILPESMCVVITVAMTISVKKMAQQKCIVRKLSVLEVLGGVTDICSDKTGTLTENKMVVKKAVVGLDDVYIVTGAPYDMHGLFVPVNNTGLEGSPFDMHAIYEENPHIYEFFRCGALCSSTILHISDEDIDSLTGSGNPTEIAIQVMTWKAQLNRNSFEEKGWECAAEYAFDSSIKRMSAVWHNPRTHELYLCTKGAPERILDLCSYRLGKDKGKIPLLLEDYQRVNKKVTELAEQGLRTICLAYNDAGIERFPIPTDKPFSDVYPRQTIEEGLIYLGLVGIYDPPRQESRPSVVACQHAGICVRMLTGDHISTAGTIAAMLHIIRHCDITNSAKVQSGPDLDKISDDVIDSWDDLPLVVGRCSPESKVKMIDALHRRKRVVAMTGDGFNDSPSIKIADVGCAMGSGVDVTKGVADLVITDDNFSTIVKAVAEGRRISQCICKFTVHLLSSNVAEVIALICGLPIRHEGVSLFVLSPLEILWLNMLTSAPPATGLSMDRATEDILLVPPNTKGLFTTELIIDTLVYGFWLGLVTLMGFVVIVFGFYNGPEGTDCNKTHGSRECYPVWQARCTSFGILYFGLFVHAYTVRHPRLSVFRMKIYDNKWIFGSVVVGTLLFIPIVYINPIAHNVFVHHMITWHWAVLVIGVAFFLFACEMHKVIKNRFYPINQVTNLLGNESNLELRQEYNTFTQINTSDHRSTTEIAEDNLRLSFVSFAESIGTASTASFRMPSERRRHKKGLFKHKK